MNVPLDFSTLDNKIEAHQKAFISKQRLADSDRAPGGVRSSLGGIPVGRRFSVLASELMTSTYC